MNASRFLVLLGFVFLFLTACQAAPTATALPPTAAPLPPTAAPLPPTATSAPPTETPLPPTATATPPPTETPRPTATDTPFPDTTVVFSQNFDLACNTLKSDNADRTLGCENGEYVILTKTKNTIGWVIYDDFYSDAVIQVDARAIAGGKYLDYGVVFRLVHEGKSFYRFTISTRGEYSLTYYADEKWSDLLPYTASSAIKPQDAVNRIKIIAQGDHLALFVNDQFLNTVTNSALLIGQVGFIIDNGEANAKVAFDNLTISRINRPLVLPAPQAVAPPPTATIPKPAGPSCSDTPPGMAGLLWINQFDGEATITIVDHEYHVPGNSRMLIPIPAGKKFVIDAFIPGVGRMRPAPGPFTWDAGYCEVWSPGRAAN